MKITWFGAGFLCCLVAVAGCGAGGGGGGGAADVVAPTGTTINFFGVTQTTANVSWTGSSDDVTPNNGLRFRVFWSAADFSDTSSATLLNEYASTQNNAPLTGLTPGATYYVAVLAVDVADNQEAISATNKQSFAALPPDTQPPTGSTVGLTGATGSTLAFSWTAATDNQTPQGSLVYRCYISTSPFASTASATLDGTTSAGVTDWTYTGLSPSTLYYVAVSAVDLANNEEPLAGGNEASASTTTDTVKPVGTVLTVGTGTATEIPLTWTPATDDVTAQGSLVYNVYAETAAITDTSILTPVFTTAAGATGHTVSSLTSDTSYFLAVCAVDAAANEESLTASNNKPGATLDTVPPAGTVLSVGTTTGTTIPLTWTAASDNISATGALVYRVYYSTSAFADTSAATLFTTTAAGATSATITSLLDESRRALAPGGWLITEVGAGQAGMVAAMASVRGFGWVAVTPDLSGIERVVAARR
jgi:hypothetical protein